jgi:hypothetical protein
MTPLATKKASDFGPVKFTSDVDMSRIPAKSTSDKSNTTPRKAVPLVGKRVVAYNNANRPSASTTTNTPTVPTTPTSGRVSLMDRIKGNIAKRKMKRMNKLSEQVGQSKAIGSYAQPTMKKGGNTKSFPDFSKDGKVTKKDILIAKGVIPKAKKGGVAKKLVKAQYGISTTKKSTTKKPLYSPAKINVTPGKKQLTPSEVMNKWKTKKK